MFSAMCGGCAEDREPMTALAARALVAWLLNCLALVAAAWIVPAIGYRDDAGTLLLAGAILGLVNLLVRPLVILLALPVIVLSLGVALLFVNALMLYITSLIVPDLTVGGFGSTLAGALIISAVNLLLRPLRHRAVSDGAAPQRRDRSARRRRG